jgi:hypothetical protein
VKKSIAWIAAASVTSIVTIMLAARFRGVPRAAAIPPAKQVNAVAERQTASSVARSDGASVQSALDYKKLFSQSVNYWTYAHEVLPAAKAGNPDAQYYLFRILDGCNSRISMFLQRRGQKLSLGDVLQYAAKRNLSIDLAQSAFDHCHDFQDNDGTELGNPVSWLHQATAAGQPLAQSTTAIKLLLQTQQSNFEKSGALSTSNASEAIDSPLDPPALFRAAVESKDPEVLRAIGEAQFLMHPTDEDTDTTRFAWWLVACQSGLDCSWNAEWVKNSCGSDPRCESASSPSDLVQRLAGDKWPDVEQRAREIEANLAANQWDELGIGP